MNVDIVMIAIGPVFQKMADVSAPLVEKHIGPVRWVTDVGDGITDAFEMKLRIVDRAATRPVLYVDADMLVLKWDWAPFVAGVFNAVDDYPTRNATWSRTLWDLFPPAHPINAGLWFADSSHADVFALADDLARGELKDHPRRLGDQTPLNRALYVSETEINRLPHSYNKQISALNQKPDPDCHVVHVVGDSRPGEPGCVGQAHKLKRFMQAAKSLGVL